jgi:hypothetical protein
MNKQMVSNDGLFGGKIDVGIHRFYSSVDKREASPASSRSVAYSRLARALGLSSAIHSTKKIPYMYDFSALLA